MVAQQAYLKLKENVEERICKEQKTESLVVTVILSVSLFLNLVSASLEKQQQQQKTISSKCEFALV